MRNLTELTASWEFIDGWKVAPDGCDFMVAGDYAKIGFGAKIGNHAKIGNYAKIGNHATIGNGAKIGNYATIGNHAKIGIDATIGNHAKIGNHATDLQELGKADGYGIIIANVNGTAYISGGCRWLTLTDALEHVAGKEGYKQRCDVLEYAKIIAKRNGWTF